MDTMTQKSPKEVDLERANVRARLQSYKEWYKNFVGGKPSSEECVERLVATSELSEYLAKIAVNKYYKEIFLKQPNQRVEEVPEDMEGVSVDNTPGPPRKYVPLEHNPMLGQLREDLEDIVKDIDLNYRRLNYRNTLVNKTLEVVVVMLKQCLQLLDFRPEVTRPSEGSEPFIPSVSGKQGKDSSTFSNTKEGIE